MGKVILCDFKRTTRHNRMNEINWSSEGAIESSIYETIRTRAYGVLLSTSIPAFIMYLVLIFIKIRFLWVYLKRFISILVLVIIVVHNCMKMQNSVQIVE